MRNNISNFHSMLITFLYIFHYSQMQMVALSRNTASVAQDFHNAGDGHNNNINNNNNNSNNKNAPLAKVQTKNLIADLLQLKKEGGAAITHPYIHQLNTQNSLYTQNNVTFQGFHAVSVSQSANNNSSPANNSSTNNITTTTTTTTVTSQPTTSLLIPPKKRRRLSHFDKENTNYDIKHNTSLPLMLPNSYSSVDYSGLQRHMKDVITRFYLDHYTHTSDRIVSQYETSPPTSKDKSPNKFIFDNITSIHDYLKNNKELTISIEPPKKLISSTESSLSPPSPVQSTIHYNYLSIKNEPEIIIKEEPADDYHVNTHSTHEHYNKLLTKPFHNGCNTNNEKRNRKQAQPRKINQDSIAIDSEIPTTEKSLIITNLRDKHLIRLVERKKTCKICIKKSSFTMPYHTKRSLMLHMLWRHSRHQYRCNACKVSFNQKYKLILHKRLNHRDEKRVVVG